MLMQMRYIYSSGEAFKHRWRNHDQEEKLQSNAGLSIRAFLLPPTAYDDWVRHTFNVVFQYLKLFNNHNTNY
jgi:hypothetical protein